MAKPIADVDGPYSSDELLRLADEVKASYEMRSATVEDLVGRTLPVILRVLADLVAQWREPRD